MSTDRILVIEDDPSIREALEILLQARGFTYLTLTGGGRVGLEYAARLPFDLVLLDLTLPDMDGLEVCRKIHDTPLNATVPVIMLTARGEDADIVVGLEMGAVDYIVKPFNNQTLVARIRAQLRRNRQINTIPMNQQKEPEDVPDGDEIISRNGISVNLTQRRAFLDSTPLELTFTEFELLLMLIRRPGRVWSRTDIAYTLKGDDYLTMDRSIDVQIANLRKKLGTASDLIETARGIGYRWKY